MGQVTSSITLKSYTFSKSLDLSISRGQKKGKLLGTPGVP